jgi:hypothetical protein
MEQRRFGKDESGSSADVGCTRRLHVPGMQHRPHRRRANQAVGIVDGSAALVPGYMQAYVSPMGHLSIRDLQKISGETIGALPGPTAVKSGDRTVGLLIPLKAADPDRLAAVLACAEALAAGRDRAADEADLAAMGIDPTDWSVDAVRTLTERR